MTSSASIRALLMLFFCCSILQPATAAAEEASKTEPKAASEDSPKPSSETESSPTSEAPPTAAKANSADPYAKTTELEASPYVFAWLNYPAGPLKLRGGTTKGKPVALDTEASSQWARLRTEELTAVERDRTAILAMQGDYRVSFDFIETELYGEASVPSAPYRSWATERVYVLSDSAEKVELQHVLVMVIVDDQGKESPPMVIKHWRQVWEYQPDSQFEFIGHRTWRRVPLAQEVTSGAWLQTVYQVDDSPRYSLLGRWEHNASYSAWNSESGHRPLPRREYTSRSDYQALYGTNRITITERGWVHSQDNLKKALTGPGQTAEDLPFLARELGVNRYDRIKGFDFSPADEYLAGTGEYWSGVRSKWDELLAAEGNYAIAAKCEDKRAYERFFSLANEHRKAKELKRKKKREKLLSKQQDELTALFQCLVASAAETTTAESEPGQSP